MRQVEKFIDLVERPAEIDDLYIYKHQLYSIMLVFENIYMVSEAPG